MFDMYAGTVVIGLSIAMWWWVNFWRKGMSSNALEDV